LTFRDRDFEQKFEKRLERAEIETLETTYLQNITNLFNIKFYTMDILMSFRTFSILLPYLFATNVQFVCFSFSIKKLIV